MKAIISKSVFNSITKQSALLFVFTSLWLMSCDSNKNEVSFDEIDQSVYQSEEAAEHVFDVIESISNSAVRYYEANPAGRLQESTDPELACADVSFEGDKLNGRVIVDYGEGCIGPDGKTRKGIVIVEYDGHWALANSEIYTVLKDFYIDDIRIEGTRILTNVSMDASALVYTEEIINGKITWPDNSYLTRIGDRTISLIFGDEANNFELQIEGGASGKSRSGVTYKSEIIEPLVLSSVCQTNMIYIPVSGIKTVTVPDKPVITINYGTGVCDLKFTVSMDDAAKEVSM